MSNIIALFVLSLYGTSVFAADCKGIDLDNFSESAEFKKLLEGSISSNVGKAAESIAPLEERISNAEEAVSDASKEVDELLENPNHSPLEMARRKSILSHEKSKLDELNAEKSPPKEVEEDFAEMDNEQDRLFFQALLKAPGRSSRQGDELGAFQEHLLKNLGNDDRVPSIRGVTNNSQDTVDPDLFEKVLANSDPKLREANRVSEARNAIEGASPTQPVENMVYISPRTGIERQVEIIGFNRSDSDYGSKVIIRFETPEGRVVSKEVFLRDLGLTGDTNSTAALEIVKGELKDLSGETANKLARETVYGPEAEELAKLEAKLSNNEKLPDNWEELSSRRNEIVIKEEPLAQWEIRDIRIVEEAFNDENLATRMPMSINQNGQIVPTKGRAYAGTGDLPKFTREEMRDLIHVQKIKSSRGDAGAPTIEDKDHFDTISGLYSKKIMARRARTRQEEVRTEVHRFTGSDYSQALPQTPDYKKYEASNLSKSYGGNASKARSILDSIRTIMRKSNLTTGDVDSARESLMKLNRMRAENSEDLNEFLNYTRNRIGLREFESLIHDLEGG